MSKFEGSQGTGLQRLRSLDTSRPTHGGRHIPVIKVRMRLTRLLAAKLTAVS